MKYFRSYIYTTLKILIDAALYFLYFLGYLKREIPLIKLKQEITAIGKLKNLGITFFDQRSCPSNKIIEIVQDNKGDIISNVNISPQGNEAQISIEELVCAI